MSALTELAYDASERLFSAAKERGDVAGDVLDIIDALESQSAQGSPELPQTIGAAAALLANLEASSTV
jgi:hypothetical protein